MHCAAGMFMDMEEEVLKDEDDGQRNSWIFVNLLKSDM